MVRVPGMPDERRRQCTGVAVTTADDDLHAGLGRGEVAKHESRQSEGGGALRHDREPRAGQHQAERGVNGARDFGRLRLDAMQAKEGCDGAVQAGIAARGWVQHQVFTGEFGGGHEAASAEAMDRRHGQHHALFPDRGHADFGMARRWAVEPDVDASRQECLFLVHHRDLAQRDLNAGERLAVAGQQSWQQGIGQRRHESDHQTAATAGGRIARDGDRLARGGEYGCGARQEGNAGIGQCDAASSAMKKRRAQFALEIADLHRQGRLCDPQRRGGSPEMKMFGDCLEIAEMAKFHRRGFYRSMPAGRGVR